MQQKLNKMVATVRQGAIEPQDASRTIHGSAAMLGLELAEVFPEKALLVTGMRKKVSKKDVSEAFKVFGEIESVAVTPNERGFGTICHLHITFQYKLSSFRAHNKLVTTFFCYLQVLYDIVHQSQHSVLWFVSVEMKL